MAKVAFREEWTFSSLNMAKNCNSSLIQGGFHRLLLTPKQAFGKRGRFFGQYRENLVFHFDSMTLPLALFFFIFSLRANTNSQKVLIERFGW